MAGFMADRPAFSLLDIEPTITEPANPFSDMLFNSMENSTLNFQNLMGIFPSDHQFGTSGFPTKFTGSNFPIRPEFQECKKRRESSSDDYSSPPVSEHDGRSSSVWHKNSRGKRMKMISNEKEGKEVVHVRAKRGQATDSHSLAERVRRERINERMRCLQDIVPGCYKTMGMAVMLDEIINYVQSLQNQVEFLSMKLTTASTYYDFNEETQRVKAIDQAQKLQQIVTRQGHEGFPSTQQGLLDFCFGNYHTNHQNQI